MDGIRGYFLMTHTWVTISLQSSLISPNHSIKKNILQKINSQRKKSQDTNTYYTQKKETHCVAFQEKNQKEKIVFYFLISQKSFYIFLYLTNIYY
jgi:hypothetical protein